MIPQDEPRSVPDEDRILVVGDLSDDVTLDIEHIILVKL